MSSVDTTDFPQTDPKMIAQDDNPIPLPPRDRNKPLLASKPRHTRKHPLIIPASSIQRTLDKVNVVTPEDRANNPLDANFCDNNVKVLPEPFYINQRLVGSDTSIDTPERDFDTESLHFEAQIDSDLAALDEIPSEDLDTQIKLPPVEGYNPITKPMRQVYGQIVDNGRRSVDLVDGRCETSNSKEVLLCHKRDHVSCEDLLEFADSKPSSRARGNDSDEVRIMSKVLGAEVRLFYFK